MDRRTLIAVGLVLVLLVFYYPLLHLVGLDRFLPDRNRTQTPARPPASAPANPAWTGGGDSTARAGAPAGGAQLAATPLASEAGELARTITIETPLYRAEFSNRGARLVDVEIKRYASAHGVSHGHGVRRDPEGRVPAGDRVSLAGGPTIGLDLGSGATRRSLEDVMYAVSESLDAAGEARTLTFTAHDSSGLAVRQTWRVRPDDYALDLEVEIRGVPAASPITDYSLTSRSWPLFNESDLLGDQRALRATSLVGSDVHREGAGGLIRAPKRFDGNAVWAGVHTRYFFAGVAAVGAPTRGVISGGERRALTPDQMAIVGPNAKPEQDVVTNTLVVALPGATAPVNRFLVYVGPNEYQRLLRYKLGLEKALDLGWAWIVPFSTALLKLLVAIYGLVKNYGLAIVLLATTVRLVLHPLNMSSMKSMRAMQRLQPEIERLKVKYKNDAQAMNTAMMALYKENKVNPAGGCLPMLVQMPVFFALYAVLFNAIELRQAPFLWITDLSAPDLLATVMGFPLRLLPIVMAGSGLLQQRMSPTPPDQAPTMYLMNVVMLVFFYNLPSGLVLYWTVMNLLTALQQWLVLRQDGGAPLTPAPATAASKSGRR